MGQWENSVGDSDDWYTPKYIFDGLGVSFDLDPAAPPSGPRYVPTKAWHSDNGLSRPWHGLIWLNPPFGGRNGIVPWADKFFDHGNGIFLCPDRTSAPWWQSAASRADAVLFLAGKVKFERPDGTAGKSPANGTTLMASGEKGVNALRNARGLGLLMEKYQGIIAEIDAAKEGMKQ